MDAMKWLKYESDMAKSRKLSEWASGAGVGQLSDSAVKHALVHPWIPLYQRLNMSTGIEVFVKGHTVKEEGHQGQLGACPFSARGLLALEEKAIPYSINYIDLDHKPDW
jgi:hypothetical protein